MTVFEAAAKLRSHIESLTSTQNLVTATWQYIVEPSSGQILKCDDATLYPNAFGFVVKYRNGNIDIEVV